VWSWRRGQQDRGLCSVGARMRVRATKSAGGRWGSKPVPRKAHAAPKPDWLEFRGRGLLWSKGWDGPFASAARVFLHPAGRCGACVCGPLFVLLAWQEATLPTPCLEPRMTRVPSSSGTSPSYRSFASRVVVGCLRFGATSAGAPQLPHEVDHPAPVNERTGRVPAPGDEPASLRRTCRGAHAASASSDRGVAIS
jgi:hypothetical protein